MIAKKILWNNCLCSPKAKSKSGSKAKSENKAIFFQSSLPKTANPIITAII
ncbi:MAG TPA: hypothetical protein HA222_04015 [Candidatus Diapherotrites archaeon]|uniref:Uncharacterized protein n=1 Tax=Candidatus Iainarchaeum sp. TaxID=3101447 RepID=A0A7J4JVI2_9ARCH|nr:hypothetical protein [Candidatus Diapherotrites archaeon]